MRRLLAAAVFSLDALAPAAPRVTVNEDRGVYSVTARFEVAHTPAVAFAVLTDYEQIPRFMPGIKTSVVRERTAGGAVIEQEAVSRFMMFSRRVHLVLEIAEDDHTLRFRDRCGKSFTRYEGQWLVTSLHGKTAITYELTAQPTFDVPEFILKRLLKRDAVEMIEQLQREIAVRAKGASRRSRN